MRYDEEDKKLYYRSSSEAQCLAELRRSIKAELEAMRDTHSTTATKLEVRIEYFAFRLYIFRKRAEVG